MYINSLYNNDDKEYTITLSDGSKLENLHLNGNNFVSDLPISKAAFDGKLSTVTISSIDGSETYQNMRCEQIMEYEGKYLILLLPIPESEIKEAKVYSDIEYLSMMTGINL